MSAADRDYWKRPERSSESILPHWPMTYWLMAVLGLCFVLQCLNDVYGRPILERYFALTFEGARRGWAWQLVTFQFLHASLLHLGMNLLGLWFMGRPVEVILGPRRFLLAYLGAGAFGGVLQAILMASFPGHYGLFVVGASAGIEGLFVIFCLLHPDAFVNLMFLIPVRARILMYVLAGIELFFTLVPSPRDGSMAQAAHPAHLGGMIFGALWIRWGWHHEWASFPGAALFDRLKSLFYRPRRSPPLKVLKGGMSGVRVQATAPSVESVAAALAPDEFIAREVDPILDKIAAHGMASLTEREHQVLAAAREKVAKR